MLQGDASSIVMLQQPHHAVSYIRFDFLSCLLAPLENNFGANFRVMLQEKKSFLQARAYMEVANSRKSLFLSLRDDSAVEESEIPHSSCFTIPSPQC